MPKKPPALPGDSVKAKLVKRILNAFRFTKNARAKEQERVIAVINRILADSLVVTARDIQQLNKQLSKTENQHFDSLISLLNAMTTCCRPAPPPPAPAVKTDTSERRPTPEEDIRDLVNKMMPILQQKTEAAKDEQSRQEKLKQIRSAYGRAGDEIDTLKLSDSLGVRYTVNLAQKVNITGIHPYRMEDKYLNYNFSALTTFSFLGYTVDGRTGRIRANFPADSIRALQVARAAGCGIQLIIQDKQADNIAALLGQQEIQLIFADTLARLLQQQGAGGVTIFFQGLQKKQRPAFTAFINTLHSQLASFDSKYTVNVVIPRFDKELAYDLQAMQQAVDFFLIDFTQASGRMAGPLAPLKGNPALSIEAAVSRYLQRDISPSRFMLLLPYYGAVWNKGADGGPDGFNRYMPYREILNRYPADTFALYDLETEAAFIEVKDGSGVTKEEIWFDDESTLGPKYDYILQNSLGGVALWTLGADDGYGELWDALVDKFVVTDTVFLDTVLLIPPAPLHLTFWQRLHKEVHAYFRLFQDPCDVSHQEYEGDTFFIYVTVALLLLFVAATAYYIFNLRANGTSWKWRKPMLTALITLLHLLVVSTFMTLFLNKELSFLGITDDPEHCHTIPLSSLLLILVIGLLIGVLAMRFLLQPLFRQDDVP